MASTASVTAGLISKTDYDTFNAKISTIAGSSLNSGYLWVGNGSNLAAPVTLSGDALLSNSGAVTIAGSTITSAKIVDNTIATADIAAGAITNVKLDTGIDASKITAGTLPLSVIPTIPAAQIASLEVSQLVSTSGYFSYAPGGVNCADGELLRWTIVTGWQCTNNTVITPAGNLGIGMSSPNARLHIETSDNTTPAAIFRGPQNNAAIDIEQTDTIASYPARINFKRNLNSAATTGSTSLGALDFFAYDGTSYYPAAKIISTATANTTGASSPGDLRFMTTPTGLTNPSERMRISDTGKVGIGTASPVAWLDVAGASSSQSILSVRSSGSGSLPVVSIQSTTTSVPLLDISAVGTSRLHIAQANGNVGISTNAPQATLHVNGFMKLQPLGGQPATCDTNTEGSIAYGSNSRKICYCDGLGTWRQMFDNNSCTW